MNLLAASAPPPVILTYFFLYLSVILLWIGHTSFRFPIWFVTFLVASILAIHSNIVTLMGTLNLVVIFVTGYVASRSNDQTLSSISGFIFFIMTGLANIHFLPGFDNFQALDSVRITQNAVPYTLYLSFDKASAGLAIVGLLLPVITSKQQLIHSIRRALLPMLVTYVTLLGFGYAIGYIQFAPKIPNFLWLWCLNNLLFTCVAEEAFYRGVIQNYLSRIFTNIPWGQLLALIISACLFGLSHYRGGMNYIILAGVAGLGYGWAYMRSGRIESSIMVHFGLNLIHVLLFTYPALEF